MADSARFPVDTTIALVRDGLLRLLKDHVKGDEKRAYKNALNKWQIEEEEL